MNVPEIFSETLFRQKFPSLSKLPHLTHSKLGKNIADHSKGQIYFIIFVSGHFTTLVLHTIPFIADTMTKRCWWENMMQRKVYEKIPICCFLILFIVLFLAAAVFSLLFFYFFRLLILALLIHSSVEIFLNGFLHFYFYNFFAVTTIK